MQQEEGKAGRGWGLMRIGNHFVVLPVAPFCCILSVLGGNYV